MDQKFYLWDHFEKTSCRLPKWECNSKPLTQELPIVASDMHINEDIQALKLAPVNHKNRPLFEDGAGCHGD